MFADDAHELVEITWNVYQGVIDAYRDPKPDRGKSMMRQLISGLRTNVIGSVGRVQIKRLSRAPNKRLEDILAHFDRPTPATDPPNRSTADSNTYAARLSGLRNLTNYIARSLLGTGGFRNGLHRRFG